MSNNQNWSNTGEQLKGALADALQSGDFKHLNNLVSQTVTSAINEVGKHVSINTGGIQWTDKNAAKDSSDSQPSPPPNVPIWQQRAMEREHQKQMKLQTNWQQTSLKKVSAPLIKIRRVGSVSNVLYQVFGGIGLGITGLVTFFRFFALLGGDTTLGGWIANLIFLLGFFGMVQLGIGQHKRLKRAERYLQLCDYRVYGEIDKLAKGTGKSKSYVIKDLLKMLERGIFPEGHLDEQKTCFMLNDVVYKQYLEAENGRRIREEESRKALELKNASQESSSQPSPQVSSEQESELQAMITEGMEYIRKLRNLNDRIPGEVISAKLFCLENLLKDIFDSVREHPEQMHRMHKLMNYYLPTTLKLVEAYEEFDRVSSPGEEILKAKAEIENTLDTINQAFRELLNTLFQDAVFDATTDAQVLKTMLAKEGLTREPAFATLDRKS